MSRVVVTGYAGFDHAMAVPALPAADTTAIVTRRLSRPWPRPGGSAPLVARRLAVAGVPVELVTWLGDDESGRAYRKDLAADGVGVDGIELLADTVSPMTWLYYADDGGAVCFYDPSHTHGAELSPRQRRLLGGLGGADWVVLTVGPPKACAAVIDERSAGHLAWGVKADPDAFPPSLVRRCLREADVVTYSAGERAFLEGAVGDVDRAVAAGAIVVRTAGRDGCHVLVDGTAQHVPVDAVPDVADTTGAGDTFLGALLAGLVRGDEPLPAARDALDATREFVLRRREGVTA